MPEIIRMTMDRHTVQTSPDLAEILQIDSWARAMATQSLEKL